MPRASIHPIRASHSPAGGAGGQGAPPLSDSDVPASRSRRLWAWPWASAGWRSASACQSSWHRCAGAARRDPARGRRGVRGARRRLPRARRNLEALAAPGTYIQGFGRGLGALPSGCNIKAALRKRTQRTHNPMIYMYPPEGQLRSLVALWRAASAAPHPLTVPLAPSRATPHSWRNATRSGWRRCGS